MDKIKEVAIKEAYGFIYVTTNLINGKRYIGQKKFKSSHADWRRYLGSGVALKQSIEKYGIDNFTKDIVDIAYSKKELNEKECAWIEQLNAVKNEDYYNLKEGGDDKSFRDFGIEVYCFYNGKVYKNFAEAGEDFRISSSAVKNICLGANSRVTSIMFTSNRENNIELCIRGDLKVCEVCGSIFNKKEQKIRRYCNSRECKNIVKKDYYHRRCINKNNTKTKENTKKIIDKMYGILNIETNEIIYKHTLPYVKINKEKIYLEKFTPIEKTNNDLSYTIKKELKKYMHDNENTFVKVKINKKDIKNMYTKKDLLEKFHNVSPIIIESILHSSKPLLYKVGSRYVKKQRLRDLGIYTNPYITSEREFVYSPKSIEVIEDIIKKLNIE